ncbi:TPA: hypothetical protein VBN14_001750 [Streptococcus agalactiae]|nr:hypothetical protein [Streptococcus agalactiae]
MEELALTPIGYGFVLLFSILLLVILTKSKTSINLDFEPEIEEQEKPAYLSRFGRVTQL